MSRIVFDSMTQFKIWISGFVRTPGRYVAYRTHNEEFILKPVINPRDNDYAYYKAHSDKDVQELLEYISKKSIPIFTVKDYEWRLDQAIGVRTVSPDE